MTHLYWGPGSLTRCTTVDPSESKRKRSVPLIHRISICATMLWTGIFSNAIFLLHLKLTWETMKVKENTYNFIFSLFSQKTCEQWMSKRFLFFCLHNKRWNFHDLLSFSTADSCASQHIPSSKNIPILSCSALARLLFLTAGTHKIRLLNLIFSSGYVP